MTHLASNTTNPFSNYYVRIILKQHKHQKSQEKSPIWSPQSVKRYKINIMNWNDIKNPSIVFPLTIGMHVWIFSKYKKKKIHQNWKPTCHLLHLPYLQCSLHLGRTQIPEFYRLEDFPGLGISQTWHEFLLKFHCIPMGWKGTKMMELSLLKSGVLEMISSSNRDLSSRKNLPLKNFPLFKSSNHQFFFLIWKLEIKFPISVMIV